MELETKEDVSVLNFVKSLFEDSPFIVVVDDFPKAELTIPTVSVTEGTTVLDGFELGNRSGRRVRTYKFDIFASSKVQRNELAYRIVNDIENGILVYNYDEGFPPDVSPSVVEHLDVISRHIIPVEILPELVEKLYYRTTVVTVLTNDRT